MEHLDQRFGGPRPVYVVISRNNEDRVHWCATRRAKIRKPLCRENVLVRITTKGDVPRHDDDVRRTKCFTETLYVTQKLVSKMKIGIVGRLDFRLSEVDV